MCIELPRDHLQRLRRVVVRAGIEDDSVADRNRIRAKRLCQRRRTHEPQMQWYVRDQQRHHDARQVVRGFAADVEPDELHVLATDTRIDQGDVGLDVSCRGWVADDDDGARGMASRDAHHGVGSARRKRRVVARCNDVHDRQSHLCLLVAGGPQGVSVQVGEH